MTRPFRGEAGAQRGQAAGDALAGDDLRDAGRVGDLGVLVVEQDAQRHGVALVGREGVQALAQLDAHQLRAGGRLDLLERRVVELRAVDPHPPPCPILDRAAAAQRRETVAGDPEQPRDRLAALGVEAVQRLQRDGERLGGEVRGVLGLVRAREVKRGDPSGVPAVEGAERLAVAGQRGRQQLGVGTGVHERYAHILPPV